MIEGERAALAAANQVTPPPPLSPSTPLSLPPCLSLSLSLGAAEQALAAERERERGERERVREGGWDREGERQRSETARLAVWVDAAKVERDAVALPSSHPPLR